MHCIVGSCKKKSRAILQNRETKAHKLCIFDDHGQTMWANHEGQGSPMSHGHNVNNNHIILHNRGVYSSQANPGDDENSTLTPNGSNSVSGDPHGLSLYSC